MKNYAERDGARPRVVGLGEIPSAPFADDATALHLVISLALVYTRSPQDCIVENSEACKPASRAERRVMIYNNGNKDLKEWSRIGEVRRKFVDEKSHWAIHTKAAAN